MKKTTFTIIGWLISIGLIVLLATKLDFTSILNGLMRASWGWLVLAAVINIFVIALKAYRWKWLMEPEKKTRFSAIFEATIIGMAGNNVLPARGGDWYKIYLLGKLEGISKTTLASIATLDKLFDGLAILILFGFLSMHSRFPVWVQRGTTVVSIVIVVLLILSVLMLIHHRRTENLRDELGVISRIAKNIGSGMSALASKRLLVLVFTNSIVVCLLQILTIWCCQMAFGRQLDIWIPALVYVAINLALTVPSAPSGVGPFEVAAVLAYTWLGVGKDTAFNIAIMYHAVQFIPVTLIGMIYYFKSGVGSLKSKEVELNQEA